MKNNRSWFAVSGFRFGVWANRFGVWGSRLNRKPETGNGEPQTENRKRFFSNRKRFESGFTLIELVLVVAVVVFMMGVFLNRFQSYQEQAEKVAMEGLASGMQSALTLQYGQLLTRGQISDEAVLLQDNPINWLQKRPRNYAGEFFDPKADSVEPGNWLFDLHSRELIYVPLKVTHFKVGTDGQPWIRFHVVTQHDASRLPSLQNEKPGLTGALFEPVEPYSWLN